MSAKNTFIDILIKQKESAQLEFQSSFNAEQILNTICAFLNNEGGWILIGYNGKQIVDLAINIDDEISNLNIKIAELISPQPLIDVRKELIGESNYVILINIIKGSRQPYTYLNNYFVRNGIETSLATPDEIGLLLRNTVAYASSWEKLPVADAQISNLINEEIEQTIKEANKLQRGKSLPNTSEEFLNYFQLLDFNIIKNGSIVLFGKDPALFFTQCQIRITVFPYGKAGSRYDDTLIITDNLFVSFTKIQKYFTVTMPMISQFKNDNWDRLNRPKYPLEALDEAILNAMVHRDYADISGEIIINIYNDRLEIINSGEIPAKIITGKSKINEHHSILRNPVIAHIFYLRGKIEKLGRGLTLIKKQCEEYNLKSPEWESKNGYTTFRLFANSKSVNLNQRALSFIKTIKTNEYFDRGKFEGFFEKKISEKTARNDINKLLEGGWVTKIGDGPSTKYVRTNIELPDFTA